jgi:hypothetical protein
MKPAIAEVVAPVSDTARRCGVCEQLAQLGYGVRIPQGEEGYGFAPRIVREGPRHRDAPAGYDRPAALSI